MKKSVLLVEPLFLFEKSGINLIDIECHIEAGTPITMGEAEYCKLNRRMTHAFPVEFQGRTYYCLRQDLKCIELQGLTRSYIH